MARAQRFRQVRFLRGNLNSPHEDILRFEGKIPTYLQLKVYIIFFFPEPFMTFPPLKWGCYAAAV